jgi:hypothetical protein
MSKIIEQEFYESVAVDLMFNDRGPMFGDLFKICGYENPNFPPSGDFPFDKLKNLQFSQVDDYFGVETQSYEGTNVSVWLYPLIDGHVVEHNPGPFDGIRISYNVLYHPIRRSQHYFTVLEELNKQLPVTMNVSIDDVKKKVAQINEYWLEKGITPGSSEALEIDI